MQVRIGRCSLCGGDVMAHSGAWWGVGPPPPPTCNSCGAVEARHDPVIPMAPNHPPRLPTTGDRLLGPWLDNWPYRITCTALLVVLAILASCTPIHAQTVHVEARDSFAGYVRATIGTRPKYPSGIVTLPNGDTVPYTLARPIGLDCWAVDLRAHLTAGQRLKLDLGTATPTDARTAFPIDPRDWYEWLGGLPQFGGVPMALQEIAADGAAVTSHWRCRVGAMFVADLWTRWYGEPWMHGEVTLTASNPSVPALTDTTGAWSLQLGDAEVATLGHTGSLFDAGTVFGDGQARTLPVLLRWPRHNAPALTPERVQAVGDVRLWPDGNPVLPAGFNAQTWVDGMTPGAVATLHTWGPMVFGLGVLQASGGTGDQADEVFVGAQALAHERALLPLYLTALKWSNRPCHHREQDGSLLNLAAHPQLVCWDGRAHWSAAVSPDRLGKAANLTEAQANGWFGPDVEHALFNTPCAVLRMRDSPAIQNEMAAIARVYLAQWTVRPGLSTTQPYAARARGWECILVSHLWRVLEDRALATAVRDRLLARFALFQGWLQTDRNALDARQDDARLGAGLRWIPWQVAVSAYGYDLAGRVFDNEAMRTLALRLAKRVVQDAYFMQAGRWTARENVRLDGAQDGPAGLMDLFGTPLAPQIVLLREPNATVQEIVGQVRFDATHEKETRWLVPR